MKKNLFLSFLLAAFIFLFFPHLALAEGEFEASYLVEYQANFDLHTHVHQEISLRNKLSNVYATQYSMTIFSPNIKNIKGQDERGVLRQEIKQDEGKTVVNFVFNSQVVGRDRVLNFSIDYDAYDLIQKNGQVWEISIPKLSDSNETGDYLLKLIAPLGFGKLSFVNPSPDKVNQTSLSYELTFLKDQFAHSGIRAVFGEFQVFDFSLKYHLENPSWGTTKTKIALPPDTAFQQVAYTEITPLPENIEVDPDGNWLAVFPLKQKEKLNVTAVGKARLLATPQENFPKPLAANLAKNLEAQPYWEVNDEIIKQAAKSLGTPLRINQFVVGTLDYNLERINQDLQRFGALKALRFPNQAICMEFTDLFIALSRAAGTPAREINGYAYTTNEKLRPLSLVADVLHSWPEYWDEKKQVWMPADPTWEKTTGGVNHFAKPDLNHFAFAIHGESSEYPPPAGSYKAGGVSSKDVEVNFSSSEFSGQPNFSIEFRLPAKTLAGMKQNGTIIVVNRGQLAGYNQKLEIIGKGLEISGLEENSRTIAILPPLAHREIPFEFSTSGWFSGGIQEILVNFDGQQYRQRLKVESIISQLLYPAAFILLSLFFTFWFKRFLTSS